MFREHEPVALLLVTCEQAPNLLDKKVELLG